ncbi:uncharacterized protein LOC8274217 [Ricinus communis]|uniref:Uncharacterized protein n=1 Tax=Ricinus communis TaxID=3988 RepID=B9RNZ0_RICCO|nr:uncharacterized protein LOC8274217 [Ricinus communis]EEF46908.1 conserved hypothetical protein [Ricinus communis]|eukprot:XP_002515459.1 uncharacterized protein LOC8274217 [Ricinus communis]
MGKDEWVRAAMTDDRVVVELLVRLKQAPDEAVSSKPQPVIPLRWGLRLPRSRPATASASSLRCDNNNNDVVLVSTRKDGDSSTRCSPTTPLSWSGGGGSASPSATADGFEETSRRSSPAVRSKVTAETASTTTNTKRSKRKKTFAELRIEEGLLMKEKMHLKKELASLNATFNEQRSRNENLKRIKLDLNLQYAENSSSARDEMEEAICSRSHQREPSSSNQIISILPMYAKGDDNTQSGSCQTHEAVSDHDKSFLLPDLNMMPTEEDPATETLPGKR